LAGDSPGPGVSAAGLMAQGYPNWNFGRANCAHGTPRFRSSGSALEINRPDFQYTLRGQRFYEEFDTRSLAGAQAHGPRIMANDPYGQFMGAFVP
jgi:hypothetical protein